MNIFKMAGLLLLIIAATTAAQVEREHKVYSKDKNSPAEIIVSHATRSNAVLVSVHGMVCSYCSLGIKKNLMKLNFVDHSRYNDGILMDMRNQLITIAIKNTESADLVKIFKAILSGGYELVSAVVFDNKGKKQSLKANRPDEK